MNNNGFTPNISRKGGRVKTPTVLQMEATECGAASLTIVLAHYGRWIPLEEMRLQCKITRDGSRMSNILYAARENKLKTKGFRYEIPSLFNLPFPMIVFWGFNHFLVLEGIKDDKFYLNDPATGPRVVELLEFEENYTGVVLALEPEPDFVKTKAGKVNVVKELFSKLSGSYDNFNYLVILGLLLIIPAIVSPVLLQEFIDRVIAGQDASFVPVILIGTGLSIIINSLLVFYQNLILTKFELHMAITETSKFLWHLMRLPILFFGQRMIGDVANRLSNNDEIAKMVVSDFTASFVMLFQVILFGGILIAFDPYIAAPVIGLSVINFIVLMVINRKQKDMSQRIMKAQNALSGFSVAGINIIETIKSTGLEAAFFQKWAGTHAKVINTNQSIQIFSNILNLVPQFISSLITFTILWVGGLRFLDGAITMGGVIAFNSLASSFTGPISHFVSLGTKLQSIQAKITSVNDVYKYKRDPRHVRAIDTDANKLKQRMDEISQTLPLGKLMGHIEFRNVTFGYTPDAPPIIKNLSMVIEPGKRVSFVGSSGSGKSTLIKLITGLYQPWEGQILFDGIPMHDIPNNMFANSLAFVDQNIQLFSGTVKENLVLWKDDVSDRDISKAIEVACIEKEINKLKGRVNGEVYEHGSNFSGGQKQRLEIARAIVARPSILVLDEATAALDPITELEVEKNIRLLGCTTIVVSHRLSTLRESDEINVFKNGEIVERGTHQELVDLKQYYYKLLSS